LKQSCIDAAKVLCCEKIICDYDAGRSFDWKHEVLQETVKVLSQTKPDIVFIHWIDDSHFDHRAVAEISLQALRSCANLLEDEDFQPSWKEIWAYSAGREQSLNFVPDALACADEKHIRKAMEALDAFAYEPERINAWKMWTQQKCRYWAPFDGAYPYADPLKYIGYTFPVGGTLLKDVFSQRLLPYPTELWLSK
jgi:LmbE family N-acetylglucosaminyl deacetylase